MLSVVVFVILVCSRAEEEAKSKEMISNVNGDEICIMETLSRISSQVTATNIYTQEIRKTLDVYQKRMDAVEDKLKLLDIINDKLKLLNIFEDKLKLLDVVDNTLDDLVTSFEVNTVKTNAEIDENEDMISNVQAVVEDVKAAVEANGVLTATIKTRQKTMLSEVRLISLYKMTNQTSDETPGDHPSGLAVDGQFVFSQWAPSTPDRTITHTSRNPNQKLWIDLGAVFRIYRVVVWNARHCSGCFARFIGTHIYADDRLVGVATTSKAAYEWKISENDPTYARNVILHQQADIWLHVSEVQVWGTGPFAEDDRFN